MKWDTKTSALVVQAAIGLVDAISYMVVAPSLVFYIRQVGGTKEQYGFILSVFSFASFAAKPVLGSWTDSTGNKFRLPYLTSIAMATLGGFLYFYASLYKDKTNTAIALIACGRILGGFGAANSALGFAYMASVVPVEEQTRVNSLLSMTRIIGMAVAPGFNVFLKNVDFTFSLGSSVVQVDSLNSVGLFLFVANMVAFLAVFFLLQEPGRKKSMHGGTDLMDEQYIEGSKWDFVKALCTPEIAVPVFTLFVVNSNFQLIETGLAPAAYHALGWGPVQTSAVLGSSSVLLFVCMLFVFYLSAKNTRDETLIIMGNMFWIVGGFFLYFLWTAHAVEWHFVLPVIVCISGFPFIGSSNRSLFTRRVDANPILETRHAFMHALLSMFASVAGFVTPSFVAAYILRRPEEVDADIHHRELSPWALYVIFAPVLSTVGILYVAICKPLVGETLLPLEGEDEANERTSLVARRRSSAMVLGQKIDPATEANRRSSAQFMGIPLIDNPEEDKRRCSVFAVLSGEMAESLCDDSAIPA